MKGFLGGFVLLSRQAASYGRTSSFSLSMALVLLALCSREAFSQRCSSDSFSVAPKHFSGARINQLTISTSMPNGWLAHAPLLGRLHTRTRAGRVKSELLFAAGDSVDTLSIAASMRHLRSTRLFEHTELLVTSCPGQPGVDLKVATRDAWTLSPVVKAHGGSTDIGFTERNAFGTGTSARVVLRSDRGSLGLGVSARAVDKPFSGMATDIGNVRYGAGQSWHVLIGTRDPSYVKKSLVYLRTSFSEREPAAQPQDRFRRSDVSLLLGRKFAGGPAGSASYFLLGAEAERANLQAASGLDVFETPSLRRSYAGVNAGLARVAARYDTVSWLLSGGGIVDVPSGLEGEAIGGLGRDRSTSRRAEHLDLWTGRAFVSRSHNAFLLADVWASGFAGDESLRASTLRTSWTLFKQARRGYWTGRFSGERLVNPDPDLRALASTDLLAPALPKGSKLAEGALAFSVERLVHLMPVTRSLMLDGAAFGGTSYRWDAAVATGSNSFGAMVVGAGFRLSPSKTPRNSVRLDFGVPITRSGSISHRPYVSLTIQAWPLFDRQRDGRKIP